jgi:hypothetical protein
MSWSASGLVSENTYYQDNFSGLNSPEHMEQFEAGVRAALAIVQSGAVGDTTAEYKVVLSGHGNAEHLPVPGWADDFVNIQVIQKNN